MTSAGAQGTGTTLSGQRQEDDLTAVKEGAVNRRRNELILCDGSTHSSSVTRGTQRLEHRHEEK